MMKRDQMRIKSYFAKSVDQAMAQAREELGDEAMLLNTRKAPADHPSGMNYEVIFGVVSERSECCGGRAPARRLFRFRLPQVEEQGPIEPGAGTVRSTSLEQSAPANR